MCAVSPLQPARSVEPQVAYPSQLLYLYNSSEGCIQETKKSNDTRNFLDLEGRESGTGRWADGRGGCRPPSSLEVHRGGAEVGMMEWSPE